MAGPLSKSVEHSIIIAAAKCVRKAPPMSRTFCAAVLLRKGEHTGFVENCTPAPGNLWVWITKPGEWMDLGTTPVRDWAETPEGVIRFATAAHAQAAVQRYFANNQCKLIEIVPRMEMQQVGWRPKIPITEAPA